MIKAGIIGGAGYTAGELVRLLLNHPEVSLEWVHSSSNAGRPLCEVHSGIAGDTDMLFADNTRYRTSMFSFSVPDTERVLHSGSRTKCPPVCGS